MKLAGKVAIVTGSSRGIGKEMALGFAREGADVVVAARSEKVTDERLPGTIHQTAKEIQAIGRRALPVKCDITKEKDVEEMVRKTVEEMGKIDILVNNAGLGYFATVMETPIEGFDTVINVNLRGVLLCIKYVLPHMAKQRSGSIINISSRVAYRTGRGGVTYAATKAAIDRFSWGLAEEVGKYNIAVNCLKPRVPVLTESNVLNNPDVDSSGWDSPGMMVKAAIFLAAQDASGVTGIVAHDEQIIRWHGLT